MEKENINVKRGLILQSFAPLFLILAIKYIDIKKYIYLIENFVKSVINDGIHAFVSAINHKYFGSFIVSVLCIIWLIATIVIAIGFKGMQNAGFKSEGEYIIIRETQNDSSATFLVTYVLPLLTEDVSTIRGLIVFLTLLIIVITLLINSNNFYQNPVLAAMKYRTFTFEFKNPASDITHKDRVYIGITKGDPIDEKVKIKRKYISGEIFLVYN